MPPIYATCSHKKNITQHIHNLIRHTAACKSSHSPRISLSGLKTPAENQNIRKFSQGWNTHASAVVRASAWRPLHHLHIWIEINVKCDWTVIIVTRARTSSVTPRPYTIWQALHNVRTRARVKGVCENYTHTHTHVHTLVRTHQRTTIEIVFVLHFLSMENMFMGVMFDGWQRANGWKCAHIRLFCHARDTPTSKTCTFSVRLELIVSHLWQQIDMHYPRQTRKGRIYSRATWATL